MTRRQGAHRDRSGSSRPDRGSSCESGGAYVLAPWGYGVGRQAQLLESAQAVGDIPDTGRTDIDFWNATLAPSDTVMTCSGSAVINPITGQTLRQNELRFDPGMHLPNGSGNPVNTGVITMTGGDANPGSNSIALSNADGPTGRCNYGLDMTEFPPPCVPAPLNLWKDVSRMEISETRDALSEHLPNRPEEA